MSVRVSVHRDSVVYTQFEMTSYSYHCVAPSSTIQQTASRRAKSKRPILDLGSLETEQERSSETGKAAAAGLFHLTIVSMSGGIGKTLADWSRTPGITEDRPR